MREPDWKQELDALIEEIEAEVRDTRSYTGRARLKPEVIDALRRVERHRFLEPHSRILAYRNHPLPIGHGQTISQPYIVALMTDLLDIDRDSDVLEVGTGSGYQAAVLAELAAHVYSVEIVAELQTEARQRLAELGYRNVSITLGNGREGWPEHAPYDAIIVTAAAEAIPPKLLEQLKPGGRMAIPVGLPGWGQTLKLITKDEAGNTESQDILPVAFVPLTGRSESD